MLGDSININSLSCNLLVLKKLLKPLKTTIFEPNVGKKGVNMDHTQNEKQICLAEIAKADHNFYFIKMSDILVEL